MWMGECGVVGDMWADVEQGVGLLVDEKCGMVGTWEGVGWGWGLIEKVACSLLDSRCVDGDAWGGGVGEDGITLSTVV